MKYLEKCTNEIKHIKTTLAIIIIKIKHLIFLLIAQ